jgi:hypothetical protein
MGTYRVSGDNCWKYACVDDAQTLYAVYPQPRIDHATIRDWGHACSTSRMVQCLQVIAHVSTELGRVCGREPVAQAFIRCSVVDDVSQRGGMHDAGENGHPTFQNGKIVLRGEIAVDVMY